MVKIKFIGDADMLSKGITFIAGGIYDVKPEVAEYLKKTFGNIEILEDIKEEVIEAVVAKVIKK